MRILHWANLENVGGVEITFMHLLRAAGLRHYVLLDAGVHPAFQSQLQASTAQVLQRQAVKRWRGIRLPRALPGLRGSNAASLLHGPVDLVVGWNTFANRELPHISRSLESPLVYYEHGSAWTAAEYKRCEADAFLTSVSEVICNSYAAERLLALRWGYKGPSTRVYCPLSDGFDAPVLVRYTPEAERLRIGVAGRLVSVKGFPLALLALSALGQNFGVDAELHVAGTGPDEEDLKRLAERLGVVDRVHFCGLVSDMRGFYDQMHIQLVPSLHEPFGRVSMEAQARGCPVVVASVDGLNETLMPGLSGEIVKCSLSIDEYVSLAGSVDRLPGFVYDPETDVLRAPRAADPQLLAEAISRIWSDSACYARYSEAARQHALKKFSPECFVDDIKAVLERVAESGY